MDKVNYKQKAIEYSIGVIIGFFILFYLFNSMSTKINSRSDGIEYEVVNRTTDIRNDIQDTNKQIDSLNMKQDFIINKIYELEDRVISLDNETQKNNILIRRTLR
jgi:peptidoglycan hydrolase CwlO-like protein